MLPDAVALAAALSPSTVAPAPVALATALAALATALAAVPTRSAVPAAAARVAAAAAAARLQQQVRLGAYVFWHHHRDVSAARLEWG